jgi:hypothetical protein
MSDDLIAKDQPLPETARATLAALVGAMIPESDEYSVPAASDPAIFADIQKTAAPMLALLAAAVDSLDASDPNLVDVFGSAHAELFPALVSIVAQCYYRDDRVMASLGMEARPPFPDGFDLEDGDWSLLDPVRERAAMYRAVETTR